MINIGSGNGLVPPGNESLPVNRMSVWKWIISSHALLSVGLLIHDGIKANSC